MSAVGITYEKPPRLVEIEKDTIDGLFDCDPSHLTYEKYLEIMQKSYK